MNSYWDGYEASLERYRRLLESAPRGTMADISYRYRIPAWKISRLKTGAYRNRRLLERLIAIIEGEQRVRRRS